MRASLPTLALALTVFAMPGLTAQAPSIYQRTISASATITGSPTLRDGQFQMSGKASMCGIIPKESSLTGEATFVIETADEVTGSLTNIAFGSKQLVTPAAKASAFMLTISVVTSNGGRPPKFVLDTDSARPGNGGIATLVTVKGVSNLKIVGHNDANESIELVVTCG